MWLFLASLCFLSYGRILNILDFGAVAANRVANVTNQQAISRTLANAKPGDTVLIPSQVRSFCIGYLNSFQVFYSLGGIYGSNLNNVTIVIDGDLIASPEFDLWPFANGGYSDFFTIQSSTNLIITGWFLSSRCLHLCRKGFHQGFWLGVVEQESFT